MHLNKLTARSRSLLSDEEQRELKTFIGEVTLAGFEVFDHSEASWSSEKPYDLRKTVAKRLLVVSSRGRQVTLEYLITRKPKKWRLMFLARYTRGSYKINYKYLDSTLDGVIDFLRAS